MIILDTHIWVWLTDSDELGQSSLSNNQLEYIANADIIGVSAISCWEVAKLVELGRLELNRPIEQWMDDALGYPGIILLELTPEVSIESTRLPGNFHRDPMDQIIVATARLNNCPLLTVDGKIIAYPHVETI